MNHYHRPHHRHPILRALVVHANIIVLLYIAVIITAIWWTTR